MDTALLIFEECRFMGELLGAVLMLTLPSVTRRARFARRAVIGGVLLFAVTPGYLGVYHAAQFITIVPLFTAMHIAWYCFLVFLVSVYMHICYDVNVCEILWFVILAYAMQHVEYVLVNEIMFIWLLPSLKTLLPVYGVICAATCAALYFVFYRIFMPLLKGCGSLGLADTSKMRLTYLLLTAMFIGVAFVNQYMSMGGEEFVLLPAIADLFCCALAIVNQYSLLRANRLYAEKTEMSRLYDRALSQYDNFKRSMEYVNIKCHDLRHQLRRLRQEGADADKLKALENSPWLQDSFVRTGNETLDMVIADKGMLCESRGIAFSYMAEGAALGRMEAEDVYALFANILDNAIDYVDGLRDPDMRYVRLTVRPAGGMLVIHQENPLVGTLVMKDGLPETTKSDRRSHGYGMKSIKYIASKYGGRMMVTAAGRFAVDVMLPLAA